MMSKDPVLDRIFAFVEENLREELTRERIAEYVHFHPVYLSRYFKQRTGMTLSQFIHNHRIETAKSLLARPELNVGQVVHLLGWCHPSHFTRSFKKATGLSPYEFRKSKLLEAETQQVTKSKTVVTEHHGLRDMKAYT